MNDGSVNSAWIRDPGPCIDRTADIDRLAGDIRRIDGNHSMGAAALAEALVAAGWGKSDE